MKTHIYITIISLFLVSSLTAQDYIPYQQTYKNQDFASQTVNYGGGENKVMIRNNVLTLSFDSNFQPSPLKTGNVVEIETPDDLPDITFGNLKLSDGTNTSYQVSIVDNWIVLHSATSETVSSMLGTFVYDLTPSDSNDNNDPVALFQHNNENYIHTVEPLYPIEGSVLDYEGAINSVVYFDGLGREKQIVNIGTSSSNNDIVTHIEYDMKGNMTKEYLPYAKTQNTGVFSTGAQQATIDYYNVSKYENTVNPYSEKITDSSPLDRIVETAAPGDAWEYDSNLVITSNQTKTIYKDTYPDFTQSWPISIFLDDIYAGGSGTVTFSISYGGGTTKIYFSGGGFSSVNLKLGDITDIVGIDLPDIGFGLLTINGVVSGYGVNITDNTINIYRAYTGIQSFNSISTSLTQDIRTSEQIDYSTRASSNNTIKFDYSTNAVYEVKLYEVGLNSGNLQDPYLIDNGYYTENQLQKKITKTEDWKPNQTYANDHKSEEFIDKNGRVILKRTFNNNIPHDTYYVYNYLGNLTYVLPPEYREPSVINDHSTVTLDWRDFMDIPIGGGGGGGSIQVVDNLLSLSCNSGFTTQPLITDGVAEYLGWTDIPDLTIGSFADGHYTAFMKGGNLYIEGDGTPISGLIFSISVDLDQYEGVTTDIESIIYQYKYDDKNRLIEKRIPGKGWEYIVYDKLDRPVLTQDANLRAQQKWLFTVFDGYGRVAFTGLVAKDWARATMQNHINTGGYSQYVNRSSSPVTINGVSTYYDNYFINNTYLPPSLVEILTVNYYDDYNVDIEGGTRPSDVYGEITTSNTKLLSTVSKVKVLSTSNWITTVNYYDDKGRLIYIFNNNDYLNTIDIVESKLGFTGQVLETKTTHKKSGKSDIVTIDKFEYDHAGRLTKQTQTLNGNTEVIAENTYDELGQLGSKGIGGKVTQSRLQNIDYTYNVRGWLKNINQDAYGDNDLFNFTIMYNDIADTSKKLFNGNISQTSWNTLNEDSSIKAYTYSYDALNRITNATDNTGNYNLASVSYDKNGNITNLTRKGHIVENPVLGNSSHFGTMDNLSYYYNGNQLHSVTDTSVTMGFKDSNGSDAIYNNGNDDYTYDENGNMKTDANKGITSISYNHINLPVNIDLATGDITYTYDATGVKLRKEVTTNDGTYQRTDYAGNYVYQAFASSNFEEDQLEMSLQFFSQPEGYIKCDDQGQEEIYSYVYQYKDHLGNIRLSYADSDQDGYISDAVFLDGFESADGWNSNGALHGSTITEYDSNFKHSGNYSGKIVNTSGETYVHSDKWLPINNDVATEYTFSGWIYSDNPTADIWLFMNEDEETGYFTLVDYVRTYTTSQWVYIEKTVSVPANIDKLNLRIDNNGVGTVWFDDIRLRKVGSEIVEESNYYPFGLKHKGYNSGVSSIGNSTAQKWKYNGKELSEELGLNTYDFGARNYDPVLGRWMNIDHLADKYYDLSPYNYTANNPILFKDPDGRYIDISGLNKTQQEAFRKFLGTEKGQRFLLLYGSANQVILGHEVGPTGGKYSYHEVYFISRNVKKETERGGATVSQPVSRKSKRAVKWEAIKYDNISKNIYFEVLIGEGENEIQATETIGHEIFVHVESQVEKFDNLLSDLSSGVIGNEASERLISKDQVIMERMAGIFGVEGTIVDHKLFVNGEIVNYEKFIKELGSLYKKESEDGKKKCKKNGYK